jgi:hypothetical protein
MTKTQAILLTITMFFLLSVSAYAVDKPEPTKEQLTAEYSTIETKYQLNQERSKVIAYENRDLLKRAQEIQAALKKMDEAGKAAEKKDEKK